MSAPEKPVEASSPAAPSAATAGVPPPVEEPMPSHGSSRAQRALSGFLIALFAAGVGACAGRRSQPSVCPSSEILYQSRKTIYIEPSMPSPEDPEGQTVLPMLQGFVAYQVELLKTRRTTLLAMEMPAWQDVSGATGPDAIAKFEAARRIVHELGTQHIEVLFRDRRPEVAAAGVRALTEAYEKMSAELNVSNEPLEATRSEIERLNARIRLARAEMISLTEEFGGVEGLAVRHLHAIEEMLAAEKALEEAKRQIRVHEEKRELSPAEISIESSQVAQDLRDLAIVEAEGELLAKKVGEQHESLRKLRSKISALEKVIEQYAEQWNLARAREAENLRIRQKALEERLAALQERTRKLGRTRTEVERLRAELDDMSRRMDLMKAVRLQFEFQARVAG